MEKKLVHNLEEMSNFAKGFLETLKKNENGATLVTLQGELGAGKTAFVKLCAEHLGTTDTITSPTFVIEKIYNLLDQPFEKLIHIDAYRLESGGELERLAWQEVLENPKNIIFLEWPERVGEVLPKEPVVLKFKFINEGVREIEYGNS